MIIPDAYLGILGGGQLGRMFCIAAQTMGYRVMVLDPDPASPAARGADPDPAVRARRKPEVESQYEVGKLFGVVAPAAGHQSVFDMHSLIPTGRVGVGMQGHKAFFGGSR